MKKLLTLSAGITFALAMQAQEVQFNADGSFYKSCISHWESKPLLELIKERDAKRAKEGYKAIVTPRPAGDASAHETHRTWTPDPNASTVDGALQSFDGNIHNTNAPTAFTPVSIDGQQSMQGYYPLDPNGMIGSNYFVQTVNVNYAVYNKNGTTKLAATDLNNLFTTAGDFGDAVVMYDKPADRWIITEFDGPSTNNIKYLLFAVSATNDPLGTYHMYSFDPDNSNRQVDDYPKYVVWGDGYYATCNCQGHGDYVMAFQRDSMLKGATAGMIAVTWNYGPWNLTTNCGGGFFCPQLLDCDGTLPPYGSPEYLFYYWDDNWGCGGKDSICIEQITMNWKTKTGKINANFQHILTGAFNSTFTGGTRADINQPGNNSADYMDALDGFFSYRIPYLRWGTYNTAVMAHVVNVGSGNNMIGAIRWYELHQDTTTKLFTIYQQSTYSPNNISRWNPCIAMDQNGSIGLAYTVSDPTSVYPGFRYTGRRTCDALNTMTIAETTAKSGNALASTPQGSGNRWGDYSEMSVDPSDGITFWATNMYTNSGYGSGTNVGSWIFSFQITKCTTDVTEVNTAAAALTAYQNGNNLIVKGTDFPENEKLMVQLFDINGRMISTKDMVSNSKTLEASFNTSSLAKAIYLVRIGNDHIQRVIKVAIN